MTRMNNDEFLQVATEQAWKRLSANFGWTESLLEKYSDNVDWTEISGNRNIVWTIPMLQKFSDKIDWKVLSERFGEEWFTKAHLEAFKDKWDWNELSENFWIELTEEMIEKFADRWNWNRIIRRFVESFYDSRGIDFYEKYKDYIPTNDIQYTNLWRGIIDQQTKQLMDEIMA